MPDTLDNPPARPMPPQLRPFAFDSAKAAICGKLSGEARRRQKHPLGFSAQPMPSDIRLGLVIEQIALTRDALLRSSVEAKDRAQLVRALCGLLDRERILRGEPLPGSRKPLPERRPGSEDRPLSPKPACGPDTPTGCVNPQVQVNEKPQVNPGQ